MLTQRDVLSSMNIKITDTVKIPGYGIESFTCKWRPLNGIVFVNQHQAVSLTNLTLNQIQGIIVINKVLLKNVKCQNMVCSNCPLGHIKCDSNPDCNGTLGEIYKQNLSNNEKFIRKDVLRTIEAVLEQKYEEGIDYEKAIFSE